MSFSDAFLDEVRSRVPVSAVVGRKVKLTRKGRELWGLCPFHNEKTSSFKVNDDRQRYHCFGCGADGTAFDFLIHTEGLTFRESVTRLAREAGLDLPTETPEQREADKRRATLLDANEAAAKWFEEQLATPAAEEARKYLAGRGLPRAALKRFRLGYAPESRNALKGALLAQGIDEALQIEAGLLVKPEEGGLAYDRFRGRITFPIADRQGRIVAFGARALGDQQPKYLNSPETPLFSKGRQLYNLGPARAAARQGLPLIVAEGYMDVIALVQAEFEAAVAPLGTALTEDQLQELWRLAPEPILCLDGDAAGRKAALRAAERALPLLKPGQSLRFALLPPEHDPDSLIRKSGKGAMQAALDAAKPLADLLWESETEGRELSTPERQAALEKRLFADIAGRIGDQTVRLYYRRLFGQRLAALFPTVQRGRLGQDRRQGKGRPGAFQLLIEARPRSLPTVADAKRERALILALVNHPNILDDLFEDIAEFPVADQGHDRLREGVLAAYAADSALDKEGLRRHFTGSGLAELFDNLRVRPEDPRYVRPEADKELVLEGAREAMRLHRQQVAEPGERESQLPPTGAESEEESWARLQATVRERIAREESARDEETKRM